MSTDMTLEIKSSNSDDTLKLGEQLGKACRGGEVFFLSSDLGGGKTTLTKGLGAGLRSKDLISSPTFTVSNIYKCKNNLELHHFDFYRLSEPGIMSNEISEVAGDVQIVTAIEWGDVVDDVLPQDRVVIELSRTKEAEDVRIIKITASESMKYLLEGIK